MSRTQTPAVDFYTHLTLCSHVLDLGKDTYRGRTHIFQEGPTRTDKPETVETIQRFLGRCRWEKVTTLRGLRVDMGKMKCGGVSQKQPCAAQAGQIQGRVKNHSAEAGEVETREEVDVDDPQEMTQEAPQSNPRTGSSQKDKCLNEPRQKRRIKWPKTNEAAEWKRLDESLSELLQKTLHGTVEADLNLLGEILYVWGGDGQESR